MPMNSIPLFGNDTTYWAYGEPTRKDLAEAAYMLDAEYRGCGINIDEKNIDAKIRSAINSNRLKYYALYVNVVKHVIDVENPHYIRPPIRYFRNAKGKDLSDKIIDRIDQIYEELDFDTFMLQTSRQSAYEGTVLALPVVDELDNRFYFNKLTPADINLKVIEDINVASRAAEVGYITKDWDDNDIKHRWDYHYHYETHKIEGIEHEFFDPHGFFEVNSFAGGQPWAVLRLLTDHSRFFGPYDGGLQSLVRTRSLLLADAIHRTQTSLYETMVMAGFSATEALAATRTRASSGLIAFEYDKDGEENAQPNSKKIDYVSPQGIAPEKIIELFKEVYLFFLTARGHSGKNFDSSRVNSTAEAQRMANISLQDLQESRKPYLLQFEQDLFKRIIWANNKTSGVTKIPSDATVQVDWQPDEQFFNDGKDKADFYDFAIKQNILTGADIVRHENPELSREAALEKFLENVKFNEQYVVTIAPPAMNAEDDENQEGRE